MAGPSGTIARADGTGSAASEVRVIAGTSNWARPIPASRPAAAAGTLSAHCSRHSWPAWAFLPTPSAANTALCVRRERRLAATLTENPPAPSSTAATPMASMACRGAFSSGLFSRAASWLARLATVRPSPAGMRGGSPSAVRSHQRVTGKGGTWLAASRSLTSARSATSARLRPKTVGNLATAATIWTGTGKPLTGTVVDEPTASRLAAR